VSIGLDSTARVVNRDSKTVNVRALEGLGDPLEDAELEPGLALKGSKGQARDQRLPRG
jgi:hypothetical protein